MATSLLLNVGLPELGIANVKLYENIAVMLAKGALLLHLLHDPSISTIDRRTRKRLLSSGVSGVSGVLGASHDGLHLVVLNHQFKEYIAPLCEGLR